MAKNIQRELQKIFNTDVKLYLNHWDREDIYVYKYKFKINGIYIRVNVPCDDVNTKCFNSLMRDILTETIVQIEHMY